MTIEQVHVYPKGIPADSNAMEHVARAFGFQSLAHMQRVMTGQDPSAFEEASARDKAVWKKSAKVKEAREQHVAEIAHRRKSRRVNRKRSKAQRARRAREAAARAAS